MVKMYQFFFLVFTVYFIYLISYTT